MTSRGSGSGGELEVLVPLGEEDQAAATPSPPTPGPPWSRLRGHRRAVIITAAVVMLLVAATVAATVPGRRWLIRRQLSELDRQWKAANEDDLGRFHAEEQLEAYSPVGAGPQVAAALAGVYREERAALLARRSGLAGAVLVDHGLSRLRGQMVEAVGDEAALLAKWAASYQAETGTFSLLDTSTQFEGVGVEYQQADSHLLAELDRWRVSASPSPAPPTYPAARDALAKLSRWLDQPTGTVLLAGSAVDGTLTRLDVDASRASPTSAPVGYDLVSRAGFLAYTTGEQVMAVGADGSGSPRTLAAGSIVFAATDPADVWVSSATTDDGLQTSEVDGTGRLLAGPFPTPGTAVGATTAGLVIDQGPGLEVWDPLTGAVRCRVTTPGEVGTLATQGDAVAWLGGQDRLGVTDLGSCRNVLTLPLQPMGDPLSRLVVAFSPNGKTLAVSGVLPTANEGPAPVELVDVASGQVTEPPAVPAGTGPADQAVTAMAWSADGQRLWWLCASEFANVESYLLTWRVGDPSVQILRAVNLHLQAPLLVATS
ncbi:MAG: hypothetical protein ACRDZ8_21750 [Acidimicrobiales bacterium]